MTQRLGYSQESGCGAIPSASSHTSIMIGASRQTAWERGTSDALIHAQRIARACVGGAR